MSLYHLSILGELKASSLYIPQHFNFRDGPVAYLSNRTDVTSGLLIFIGAPFICTRVSVFSPLLPGPFAGTPQTYVKAGVLSGKLNPSLHVLTTTSAHRWLKLAGSHGWCLCLWVLVLETLRGVGYGEAFVKIKQRLPRGLVRHHAKHRLTEQQRSFIAKICTDTLKSVKYTKDNSKILCVQNRQLPPHSSLNRGMHYPFKPFTVLISATVLVGGRIFKCPTS